MDPVTVKTQREVAQVFGVGVQAVRKWVENGMPGSRGNYDLSEIRTWKESRPQDGKNLNRPSSANGSDLKVQRLEEEVGKLRADRIRAERNNEFIDGQFIDRHLVENFVSQYNQHIRNELLRLPVELRSSYPEDIRQTLEDELTQRVHLFLESLASWQERVMEMDVTDKLNRAGRPAGK